MMPDVAIRIQNLSRDFETVRAVDNLSLEVPRGIIFGFLGPNGSGKTTTIRLLLGLLAPTAGHASVLGFNIRTQADQIRERTGALLEHNGLYEQMTAEENLEFHGRIYRLSPQERQTRIQELLTHLNLWDRRGEIVGDWSKGMRQKLAIARALLHRPPLLFLDEPTSGLDPIAAVSLRDDLSQLTAHEGITVFLNTHNLSEAEKLCSQVGIIRAGKLMAVGAPDQLREQVGGPRIEVIGRDLSDQIMAALRRQPQVAAVYRQNSHLVIDLAERAEINPLISLMIGSGVQIEEIRRSQSSLEDVFISLMNNEEGEA